MTRDLMGLGVITHLIVLGILFVKHPSVMMNKSITFPFHLKMRVHILRITTIKSDLIMIPPSSGNLNFRSTY